MAKDTHFPQVGEVFEDRYQVERVLGRGGFSRVYLATQVDLERSVALKVLNPDNEKVPEGTKIDIIVERFEREAKIISKFKDSHTVVMHDFGRTDHDLLFMVLEHVDGMNLRQLVQTEGAIEPKRVVRILRQILSSLQEAHAFGVLHRDIKPQNIMIYEHVGRRDQVKVLDFGIAKTFADEERSAKKLTMQGTIVGTPRYMSPEQLRGEVELGPPSDIYSLGLVVHELLTGQKVAAELSGLHVVERHLNHEPISLPADVEMPGALREIVDGMLAKSLSDRYADCDELLEALEDWKGESAATPSGSVPRPKERHEKTVENENGSSKTVRLEATSTARPTVQIPANSLSQLAADSVADTVADRPALEPAAKTTRVDLRVSDEALADTLPDRKALDPAAITDSSLHDELFGDDQMDVAPPPAASESEVSESREFSAPVVRTVEPRDDESSTGLRRAGKVSLVLLAGIAMALGGWYVSKELRGSQSPSTVASVEETNPVAPVENEAEEPVATDEERVSASGAPIHGRMLGYRTHRRLIELAIEISRDTKSTNVASNKFEKKEEEPKRKRVKRSPRKKKPREKARATEVTPASAKDIADDDTAAEDKTPKRKLVPLDRIQ